MFNRPRSQLQEEQRKHIIELYDEKPYTTTDEAVESLTKTFEGFSLKRSRVNSFILHDCNLSMKKLTRQPVARNDITRIDTRYEWVLKWTKTNMDYMQNCIFIDESAFDINMRPSFGRSIRNTPAVAEAPVTRAETHTILGAISTIGVVNIDVRVAQMRKKMKVAGARKRKVTNAKANAKTGTRTGHYLEFLKGTLDQLDRFPELKRFYLVVDNAPIHTHDDIDNLVTSRGYRCIYLPPYLPELNPIEQFWANVKNSVKRSKFDVDENLHTRITEACNNVSQNLLRNCIQHSVNVFSECLNKESV